MHYLHLYFVISMFKSVVVFRLDLSRGGSRAGTKICHGVPILKKPSSSDLKATATNQMHSNDLEASGMKCCCFWFRSQIFDTLI